MRAISFNLQKDRDQALVAADVRHFTRHMGLVFMNEAYTSKATLAQVAKEEGFELFHPDAAPGQDWNAAMWDPKAGYTLVKAYALQLTTTGYHTERWLRLRRLGKNPSATSGMVPIRWSSVVVLERGGHKVAFYVTHFPPAIERGGVLNLAAPTRVRLLEESCLALEKDVAKLRKQIRGVQVVVVGDLNVRAENRRSKWFPARFLGDRMGLASIWTPDRRSIPGTLGNRHVDDFRHSPGIKIGNVRLAQFEGSDHNPPIVDFYWRTV